MSDPSNTTPPPPVDPGTGADVNPDAVGPTTRPLDPTARWKAIVIFVILVVAGGGFLFQQLVLGDAKPQTKLAPDVTFLAHDGHPVRLADYRGKIVLMNFWATWCPPCVAETPSFARLAAKLKAEHPDIAIIAASLDDDGWSSVDPFVQRMKAGALPIVLDATPEQGGGYRIGAQAAKFGTFKLPETWIIGRDGHVLKRFVGAQNWDDPSLIPWLEGLDKSDAGTTRAAAPASIAGGESPS